MKALKECKDGALDLDVEIAKVEARPVEAQKIVDDFPLSEGSDEDEDDDENTEGDDGECVEGGRW